MNELHGIKKVTFWTKKVLAEMQDEVTTVDNHIVMLTDRKKVIESERSKLFDILHFIEKQSSQAVKEDPLYDRNIFKPTPPKKKSREN